MIRAALISATCAISLSLTEPAQADDLPSYPDAQAIVTIGGPVTEILYALDAQDRIVARDTTSTYPAEVATLPDVGYMRRLSAEGVLSVGPDLIVSRHTAGPVETLDLLREASVPIVLVQDSFDAASVPKNIRHIGHAIGATAAADALATSVEADLAQLADQTAKITKGDTAKKRVMFILSNDGGRLNVAGRDTGAHGIITLAGAVNVMGDDYAGYKLVNDEAIIAAKPDLILMMTGRGDHAGRKDDILSLPAIALTPAGAAKAFYTIDGAALGFGPRVAQFGLELHQVLYGAMSGSQ